MSTTRPLAATVDALCGDLGSIRAPRGTELNARSWSTEAPLRMLLNNLENFFGFTAFGPNREKGKFFCFTERL